MSVEVRVPEQFMGEVNRDLNGRRGRVLGMDQADGMQVITAHVPQAELFAYATELRSLTGGRGTFSSTVDHYEEVPAHLAEKVIEAHRKDRGGRRPLRPVLAAGRDLVEVTPGRQALAPTDRPASACARGGRACTARALRQIRRPALRPERELAAKSELIAR